MGSFMGRGNQYIQLVKVLYCKLLTIGKKLSTFPHRVQGFEPPTTEVGSECVTTVPLCLFGVLRRFQHCTGHITTGSWKGRGNQYIEFARVQYCKLPTDGKQLPAFPLQAMTGIEPRPQRWEARVLPLCHRCTTVAPVIIYCKLDSNIDHINGQTSLIFLIRTTIAIYRSQDTN